MRLRRIISAPLRFYRYLDTQHREMQARYEVLSEEEKAERRERGLKLYWTYAAFPSPARKRRKD